jgi:hypothetical protein
MTKTIDKRTVDYLKMLAKDQKELLAYVKKLPAYDGFKGEWEEDRHFFAGENRVTKNYVLANDAKEVKFTFRPGGSGTTSFNTANGWRTFDRTGVEDSFYWKPLWEKDVRPEVKVMIDEQMERIAKSRDFAKTAVRIPQIGFTVSPDLLARLKETFKRKGYHAFHPSGFGTGYTVSGKKLRFSNRASKEMEDFFGVAPLYIETFDAD